MENDTILDLVLNLSGASGFDDNTGDFDLLREAVLATDLAGALGAADADLSVFAPTDAAFIQLARDLGATVADGDEAGALNGILAQAEALTGSAEAGLALVKDILLYHVLPGERTLAELDAGGALATLNSAGATVEVDGTTVIDNEPDLADPTVALADVKTGNGTVQAIDRVLLPVNLDGNETIVTVAANDDRFEILVKAVTAAGLVDTLSNGSDLTVFAPTDAAFAALAVDLGFTGDSRDEDAVFDFLVGALTELGGGDPIPVLTDILLYHVSPGAKTAAEIGGLSDIPNLLEAPLAADGTELTDVGVNFVNPDIVVADVPAGDNLIQAIDRVLIPLDLPGPAAINGTSGRDMLEGAAGDDLIRGGLGGDTIEAGGGDDRVFGGKGRDIIEGEGGADRLAGGKGRDALDGGAGNDVLLGGKGADHLDGGGGDDTLRGGPGRDTLEGGAGDDLLSGGAGPDVFDFAQLDGNDRVAGFNAGDRVVLSEEDFADFDAFIDAAEQSGSNVVVSAPDGDTVTFQNTTLDQFHDGLLIFV